MTSMIDFAKTKPGDKLRIVGEGAPGYAKLGDVVTVTSCNGKDRCEVVNDDGKAALFGLTCGAARLALVNNSADEIVRLQDQQDALLDENVVLRAEIDELRELIAEVISEQWYVGVAGGLGWLASCREVLTRLHPANNASTVHGEAGRFLRERGT
jgi:hypothetical protein